jgi:ElaB/YqjD/DUF883 family membrane-anchored ribosome-binding protein
MSILSHNVKSDLSASRDKIHAATADVASEFKSFVSDIEGLLKETASLTGDDLARAKIKLNQRINAAKECVNNASGTMLQQARKTATITNEYVHQQPWAVIGTSAVVSFALGMLLSHRDAK